MSSATCAWSPESLARTEPEHGLAHVAVFVFNGAMRLDHFRYLSHGLGMLVCAMLLAACSSGDDDSIYDGVLSAAFEGEESELGIFLPWERFYNRCDNPRARGERGATQADSSGTETDEKNFVRSFMYDTYLWYDQVNYINPAGGESVVEYFFELRTTQQTPSGRPRDRFSGLIPYTVFEQVLLQGTATDYGFEGHYIIRNNGEIVLFHVEPDSPAGRNGLTRGARILSVEGRRYSLGVDPNDLLYPSGVSSPEGPEFEVRDLGSTTTRTFRMRPSEYTADPVRFTRVIDTDTGPVGYILFNDHNQPSEGQLIEAFKELADADVTDLVLDLRYNGGGFIGIASEVASMIAGPSATSGKIFELYQYNDQHPTRDPFEGEPILPVPFTPSAYGFSVNIGTPLPNLNLKRLFVLATGGTCSASEAIINGLRGVDVEVILVGDTTCGKPYGSRPFDNCGIVYLPLQFRGVNDKGFGEFPDGFAPQNATGAKSVSLPGCAVADDPDHLLGDPEEAKLAAALQYRSDGTCPPPSKLEVSAVPVGPMTERDWLRHTRLIMEPGEFPR